MKQLIILVICILSLPSFAQDNELNKDTIFLKTGETHIGKLVIEEIYNYQFLIYGSKKASVFPKETVTRISTGNKSLTVDVKGNFTSILKKDSVTNENLLTEFKKLQLKTQESGWHLKTAGGLGIASGLLIIGGGAMALAGALTGKPVISYIGSGIGGLGLVLTIPAFINIHKAGTVLSK